MRERSVARGARFQQKRGRFGGVFDLLLDRKITGEERRGEEVNTQDTKGKRKEESETQEILCYLTVHNTNRFCVFDPFEETF